MKQFLACFAVLFFIAIAQADNHYVVRQSTSSDCGPAALATLLRYYLDVPTTEEEMMRLAHSNSKIGTTFLGLEQAAEAKGCSADSFRMNFDTLKQQLATYPGPVIIRTLLPQPHFSVLLAINNDSVFVADPSAGNIILLPKTFLSRWLFPGTTVGLVFIAAAPESHLNTAHYQETIQGLSRQLRNLQTAPAQSPMLIPMLRR